MAGGAVGIDEGAAGVDVTHAPRTRAIATATVVERPPVNVNRFAITGPHGSWERRHSSRADQPLTRNVSLLNESVRANWSVNLSVSTDEGDDHDDEQRTATSVDPLASWSWKLTGTVLPPLKMLAGHGEPQLSVWAVSLIGWRKPSKPERI